MCDFLPVGVAPNFADLDWKTSLESPRQSLRPVVLIHVWAFFFELTGKTGGFKSIAVDHPLHTEFIAQHAKTLSPELWTKGHSDFAIAGQFVE